MSIQVTWEQFLVVLNLFSPAQSVVFYVIGADGKLAQVMIRDAKLGGTGVNIIGESFPTEAEFLLLRPTATKVSGISG